MSDMIKASIFNQGIGISGICLLNNFLSLETRILLRTIHNEMHNIDEDLMILKDEGRRKYKSKQYY
jgi:hypothetical protein